MVVQRACFPARIFATQLANRHSDGMAKLYTRFTQNVHLSGNGENAGPRVKHILAFPKAFSQLPLILVILLSPITSRLRPPSR